MIVITKIETIETNRDWIEYVERELPYLKSRYSTSDLIKDSHEIKKEYVKGIRFRRPDGEMLIGISKQAGEVLGICYEAYDNQHKMYQDISDRNFKLQSTIQYHLKYTENLLKFNKLTLFLLKIFDAEKAEQIMQGIEDFAD